MPEKTRSQIGRSARAKGGAFQATVARALRPWFPDVRSGRDNGSKTTSDAGDLAETCPALFWSLKNDESGVTSPPGLIRSWMEEARGKAGARIPLLVQKRKGHADPLKSWCWLYLPDLLSLTCEGAAHPRLDETTDEYPVRMELAHVLDILARGNYALRPDRLIRSVEPALEEPA